ncbi:hypothetical protein DKY63_15295 [Pseudomonas putida]|uniref:Uncharacterized protein n=1 Tax=Pseudomonas putida TaxID=303 RepID=A0A2Z4RJ85_PSEPU|nr:hypothetical protein DKY63_15295 [Pseudomonas putida]
MGEGVVGATDDPPLKRACFSVGASLLAIVVNDYACLLANRGVLESIASRLAPTESKRMSEHFLEA